MSHVIFCLKINVGNAEGHHRQINEDKVNKQLNGTSQNVPTTGSKTYTVTRNTSYNSNQFDSEEESVTPTRSLLEAVHMNSDSGSETELKSSHTTGGEYRHHRYADQNDTFNKFSEQNREDNFHSLPVVASDRTGGTDQYRLVRDVKSGSLGHSISNGVDSRTQVYGSHEPRSLGFSNSMSRSQRIDPRGSGESGTPSTDYDLSNSRRGMQRDHQNSQSDLPLSIRSKVRDTSDTYSYGYGTQLTPITSSSELIALGQVDDGIEDVSRYEFKVGKLKIVVYRGDITKATTRGLVNAANGYLAHGAGVAGAIAMAAGHSMQLECQKIIKEKGMLDTGSVVHTTVKRSLSWLISPCLIFSKICLLYIIVLNYKRSLSFKIFLIYFYGKILW